MVSQGSQGADTEKVSVEYMWREFLRTNNNYAYSLDMEDNPVLYYWGGAPQQQIHWRPVRLKELMRRADTFLADHPGKYGERAKRDCAKTVESALPNLRKPLKQDKKQVKVACDNAVLFFKGSEIEARQINRHGTYTLAHDDGNDCRGHLFDVYAPINIDPQRYPQGRYTPRPRSETEKGRWGKLVQGMFHDEEDLLKFQEFFGDMLTRKPRKAFPVLVGPADSGKSQLLIVLRKLIANHALVDLTAMEGFNRASWVGKSALIVDEGPKTLGDRVEAMIKRLIGGAGMIIERKFDGQLFIDSDFKMIWCLNKMINFIEKSDAIRVRMRPFATRSIPKSEQEEGLGDLIVEQEMELVLDWALEGLLRIEQRGRALKTDELSLRSQAILDDMRRDTNPALTWIQETELVPSTRKMVPLSELLSMYRAWAEVQGHRGHAGVSLPVFTRDYLGPAMEHLYPDTWCSKKVRAMSKRTGNRENHLRVEFRNNLHGEMMQADGDENQGNIEQLPRVVAGPSDPFK